MKKSNLALPLPTRWILHWCSTIFLLLLATTAAAHATQENYVWLNVESDHVSGRFEVNVKDLKSKLGVDLDASSHGDTRLDGVVATSQQVQAFLRSNFSLRDSQGEIAYQFGEATLFQESDEFVQYHFRSTRLPVDDVLTVDNSIWLTPEYVADDWMHRSLLVVEHNAVADKEFGQGNVALVFGPKKLSQEIDLSNPGTVLQWKDFFVQGILHIAIGLDHILFIVVLLLTAVVRRQQGGWVAVEGFRPALWNMLKIITIFTVAHSITLSLAALNLVDVSPVVVETIIAISIIAMAINNIFPRFSGHAWMLIFAFGLFHGLGFASVMGDLQFRTGLIERILLMFNVGVEAGQLLIVLAVFPLLFLLRKKSWYRMAVVNSLSVLAIIVSMYWVAERTGLVQT